MDFGTYCPHAECNLLGLECCTFRCRWWEGGDVGVLSPTFKYPILEETYMASTPIPSWPHDVIPAESQPVCDGKKMATGQLHWPVKDLLSATCHQEGPLGIFVDSKGPT